MVDKEAVLLNLDVLLRGLKKKRKPLPVHGNCNSYPMDMAEATTKEGSAIKTSSCGSPFPPTFVQSKKREDNSKIKFHRKHRQI